jgi:pimeloyl-ACP methyl ester carboxylesterase
MHGMADIPVYNAHRNAKAIPGAHLRLFENAGHYFWLNHLEELGELLSS